MTVTVSSPWQTRMLQITSACLLVFTVGTGLLYQFKGWKLDGGALILVGGVILNYVSLLQCQLGQASARVDELENKLAAH